MPKPQSENIKVKNTPRPIGHPTKEGNKKEQDVDSPNSDELKNEEDSGFAEFTKKPLPSEKEVKQLDDYVETE